MDIKNIEKISNDELEHYLFTPDGIGKIGKKIVFDELFKRRKESEINDLQALHKEPDPNDFRTEIIKMLNEEFGRLDDHELGKVYKFIRTKLIAGL